MKPRTSKVAHFENVDLRDLRVTPASLRLRRFIIGASITYILTFTPVMAYFIHTYMMAAPDLSRPREGESGEPSKTCSNRRLPSFHLGFHRAGRHAESNGSAHANDSRWDPPPSGRQMDSVANFLRNRSHQANWTASGGGGSPMGPTFIGHQQAAGAEADKSPRAQAPEAAAPISERVNHVDNAQLATGGVLAVGAAGNQMLQKQQQWGPDKQREAGGQTQPESMKDYPPMGFRIDELPVQIGRQEMAVGEDPHESSYNGRIRGNPAGGVVGSAPSQDGGHRKLKAAREMLPASSQKDAGLRDSEEKQSALGNQESSRRRKDGQLAMEGTLLKSPKARVKTYADNEFSVNGSSEVVGPHVSSNGQGKDNAGVPREDAVSSDRKSMSYANGAKGFGKDKRGYKGALASAIGKRTAEELRRLRSEKLMLKLRKAHNLAKQFRDPKRGTVFGRLVGKDGRESARQVDIALQRELAQMTEGKGRNGNQTVRVSGAGFRARSDHKGSAASSADNSDKQRMIEGIPSNNKEANEVLSFAEFFKKHLSPKQRPSKVLSGVDALQGRRLMIDYMTKKKGKDTLQEGFPAGGWPEKPEASPPTKYTLDPYHPYISRRGDGWDFYDPLKPTTERNNARELAEQEFYSPERPAAELTRRLAGRLQAPPPPSSVPSFGFNESSLQGIPVGSSQGKGSAMAGSESAAGGPANIRPAVSAAIRHSFPGQKAKLENSDRGFRANSLSPNLIGRYAVTEGTIPAVFRYETAVGGKSKKSEPSSADLPSGLDKAKSDSSLEQRHAFARSEGNPVRGDAKEFPPGNLTRDQPPRSGAPLPVTGGASYSSMSTPEDKAAQRDVHNRTLDSNAAVPNFGNSTGSGNDKSEKKAPRGSNAVKDNREHQKQEKRGSPQNERNVEVHDNGLPSSGSRASDADEKSNSTVFAGVSTNRGNLRQRQGTGGSGAAETKVPGGDSASMKNSKLEFARNDVEGSTSAGNAVFPNDSGAPTNNSMVHPGLINIEPIPIETPDFIANGSANATNVTAAGPDEDWAALSTHGKEYDDIVPEEERGIYQSPLNRNHHTFLKEDVLSGNSSASLPTSRQNDTQSFHPEVMDLTPPRIGSASPTKREFTRSSGPLSSPGSVKPAPLATQLTTDEVDDMDDARNHEQNYLRIDARAVTKAETFTEPSNADIIIQNKQATSRKLRTTGVVLNEVPEVGVPRISGNHVPSAGDATGHLSQSTMKASSGTQARTSETPIRVRASTHPRDESGLVSTSPKASHKSITPNQNVHQSTVYTPTSPDDRERKALKYSPPVKNTSRDDSKKEPGTQYVNTDAPIKDHNVTVATPKIRPSLVTSPASHSVKSENANTATIEVLRKRRGHRRLPFESTKESDTTSRYSTSTGHRLTMTTFKNADDTASTSEASKRAANRRAHAEESSTPKPTLGTVKVTLRKGTRRVVPSKKAVHDEKYNSTHSSTHTADERGHFELMTRSTRSTAPEGKGKSSSSTSSFKMSLTGSSTTPSTGQHIRVSDVERDNGAIHVDKRSPTPNRNETSQVRRDTRKVSSATSLTVTTAARDRIRSEGNATTVPLDNERGLVGGGKTSTPTVGHLGKETSDARVPSIHTVSAETSTSIDKRMGVTIDVEQYSKNSGEKMQPEIERSTTKKLDRLKKEITPGHATNVHSDTEVRERAVKPVTLDLVTKSSRHTTSPPSGHSNVQKTPTKTTLARDEDRTRTSTLKSSHPTPVMNSTKARAMTAEVTVVPTRDTPVQEGGGDMLGMLDKRNKTVMSTSIFEERTTTFKQTSTSGIESHGPDVSVERETNPQLVTVSQTKSTEERTHAGPKARAEQTTLVEKLQTSSKMPFPEGPRSQQPKAPSSEDVTSTSSEPTALVFDDDDDEDEDEASLHFPMMRITRRPSTTPRRPALMDLFGRRHLSNGSTTTLRPVLLHNIIARRGGRDANQTTRHHRLQQDIAVRRRHHHESPPPKPYQMTLFHGEPLHAVRVAVKRRG